jgi:hypothetical protein
MQFFTLTPIFRQFLFTIMSAVRLHQPIIFYYDTKSLSQSDSDLLIDHLSTEYEKFYNVTVFNEFVPGFLTNLGGSTLVSSKFNYTLVIFLNYNPRSPRQLSLLSEFIKLKYEYIIISPYEIDLVALVPFIYINLNLNNLSLLKLFNVYLINYLKLFINIDEHRLKGHIPTQTLYNYNCFYGLVLLKNPDILKRHLEKHIKSVKDILTPSNLLKILLKPTTLSFNFFNYYVTENKKKILNLYHNELKTQFLSRLLKLFKFIKKKYSKNIKQYKKVYGK